MGWLDRWKNRNIDRTAPPDFIGPGEPLSTKGLNQRGRPLVEGSNKENLHLIVHMPELQELITSVLAPFFSVASVERHNGRWYSAEPVGKKFQAVPVRLREKVLIDIRMIEYLVRDWDHRLGEGTDSKEPNIAFTSDGYYFFDFVQAREFFDGDDRNQYLQHFRTSYEQKSDETKAYARNKVNKMLEYWQSSAGRVAIEEYFRLSNKTARELFAVTKDYSPEDFRQTLVSRVRKLKEITQRAFLESS